MKTEIHNILCAESIPALLEKEAAFLAQYPDHELSFKRYFLSDRQQKDQIPQTSDHISYVIQPVLGKDRFAVWIYLTKDCPVELVWSENLCSTSPGSEQQTRDILNGYEETLAQKGMNIAEHCVRTWFYVDDIDRNYAGVVVARRENFEQQGMTKQTHYLASTGICGGAVREGSLVQMDALAIKGPFTQRYLYAPANFNPTHEYGVTFERGVAVDFGGLRHILISGTASINNKGEIVHPGDVRAQALRMFENVEALLSEAGSTWTGVQMAVAYLRRGEDYVTVAPLFEEKFGTTVPYVITLAPVCRPGWLIEMECIAAVRDSF